jgi:hypothetical protein
MKGFLFAVALLGFASVACGVNGNRDSRVRDTEEPAKVVTETCKGRDAKADKTEDQCTQSSNTSSPEKVEKDRTKTHHDGHRETR